MQTVRALFDTYDEVTAAVDALSDAGVASEGITVVAQRRKPAVKIAQAAALGAAIGGIGGILLGFVAFAIPALGLLVGLGALVPALIGATTGCVAGAVIALLISTARGKNADSRGDRRGSTLVTAQVDDNDVARVMVILRDCGAIDTNNRRSEYASDSWDGMVTEDIWDEDIGREDTRSNEEKPTRPT